MITPIVIASSVALASLLAWVVQRYELSREPASSSCARIVRTRHRVTKFGRSTAVGTSGSRVTEETLREGDSAYALGEISIASASGDGRRLHAAEDGRRLLVSNFDEAHLVFVERVWFWAGTLVFAAAILILAWSYYQRYHAVVAPG